MKRIGIYHSKDMDGFTSGAILKHKYPDIELIGWDYGDPIPKDLNHANEVIMIDITFPLDILQELGMHVKLIVIDHHISFFKEIQSVGMQTFEYVYQANKAACEIGWEYFFPNDPMPWAVKLIGRYDTWRKEDEWEEATLPFKYYMYSVCNSPETSPHWLLNWGGMNYQGEIRSCIEIGKGIMRYQDTMSKSNVIKNHFIREAFGGLQAVCLNDFPFSSETMKTVWNPLEDDIMVGFNYSKDKWRVSLRSEGNVVDCSLIAKERGGGGHFNAAGFEVEKFEDIFK